MTAEPLPVPVIVGGVRSGTTMFCLMLHAHPDLAMGFESYFVPAMWPLRDRWERPDGFDLDLYVTDLLEHPSGERFRERMAIPPELLRGRLRGVAPIDYAEAVRRVYRLYAEGHGKARYGEKTAGYIVGLPLLADLFPETRYLHIIRDGRDAATAHRAAKWGPDDLVAAGQHWAKRVTSIRAFGRALGARRYMEVHYEHLLDDTANVLKAVCAFTELEYDSQMLDYHERGTSALVGVRARAATHHSANLPPTAGLREWRRDMTRRELERFETAVGDVLDAFDYERAIVRPSLRARVGSHPVVARVVRVARRRLSRARGTRK